MSSRPSSGKDVTERTRAALFIRVVTAVAWMSSALTVHISVTHVALGNALSVVALNPVWETAASTSFLEPSSFHRKLH